ncbi:GNAT family N-acetyltransferase [Streptomyces sp. ODS05-4]|uniref:GNAT family N-acetyltransferase n=1 Tax=Streptomyces sp. ODS05-4 TaxID=2944939 RepID=UPI00210CABC3|nr:GNAT family N-acetyltransferase [Streptomyces sp. ODS05-4]
MDPVRLTTARLLLDAFTPEDAAAVHAACQDPAIRRWTAIPSPYAREHAESFVRRTAPDGWSHETEFTFAVRPARGGPPLGAAAVHHPRPGYWEVGYWTGAAHRGRGVTTEAVRTLARWAFTDLACPRLDWRAEVGNTASRRTAERAGFTVEGVQRAALHQAGTLRDCWTGSLLPSDLGLPSPFPYLPAPAPATG